MDPQINQYRVIFMRIIIILAILVTVYFSMFYFFPLIVSMSSLLLWGFMPFILALIISILIDPIVDYLAIKKNINRSAAVGLALTLVLILLK
jgi:predicted PurR-regulated permease PerM